MDGAAIDGRVPVLLHVRVEILQPVRIYGVEGGRWVELPDLPRCLDVELCCARRLGLGQLLHVERDWLHGVPLSVQNRLDILFRLVERNTAVNQ